MVIQSTISQQNQKSPFISKTHRNLQGDVFALEIYGNINSMNFILEGRGSSEGTWVPLAGINLTDFSVAKGEITKPGLYEFGVASVRELRLNLTQINGEASFVGRVISTSEA